MTFFDSHCTQERPLEGRALAAAESSLPASAAPSARGREREPHAGHARERRRRGEGVGSERGGPMALVDGDARCSFRRVWNEYHIYVGKPVDGDIPHTEALYLIDSSRGRALRLRLPVRDAVRDPRPGRARARADGRRQGVAVAVVSDGAQAVPVVPAVPGASGVRGAAVPWRDYLTLTKPRIMSLLVLTSVCAMVAAAGRSAGAARSGRPRGRGRPGLRGREHVQPRPGPGHRLPDGSADRLSAGRVRPDPGRACDALRAAPVGARIRGDLVALDNLLAAALALLGGAYYVLVYTLWLKRTHA